jgi:hypothetical protein
MGTTDNCYDIGVEIFAYLQYPGGNVIGQGNASSAHKLWSIFIQLLPQLSRMVSGYQEIENLDLNALLLQSASKVSKREWGSYILL